MLLVPTVHWTLPFCIELCSVGLQPLLYLVFAEEQDFVLDFDIYEE